MTAQRGRARLWGAAVFSHSAAPSCSGSWATWDPRAAELLECCGLHAQPSAIRQAPRLRGFCEGLSGCSQ